MVEQDPGFVIADFATVEVEPYRLLPALHRHGTWKLGDPDVNWSR